MLRKLRVEHLVLVDSCEVVLHPGFHVITGETGSGKSILLTAIGLLLGEKADTSSVRQGETLAVVEGEFDLSPSTIDLLRGGDIDCTSASCTIRRELSTSGKSRAFIDGQLVPLGFLKRLGASLVEISDQHACLTLKEPHTPRHLVDQYGRLGAVVEEFQDAFCRRQELLKKKDQLLTEETERQGETEHLRRQLDEIASSDVLSVDDNALFRRLSALEHSKETYEMALQILSDIERGPPPLQQTLFRLTQKGEKLAQLDSAASPIVDLLTAACSASREAANELQRFLSSQDHSEEERAAVDTQLKRIDAVKRQYGMSHEEICSAKQAMERRLSILEGREAELEQLTHEIRETQEVCDRLAKTLTNKRSAACQELAAAVEKQLRRLNMPKAHFTISIFPEPRTSFGDDNIKFCVTPNIGEKEIDISEAASGGELARVFLAVQAVMADLFSVPTILFDEIDASIGGMTAHAVGETLAAMGKKRQVLAVTHFVQVASKADRHFALSKEEQRGRTVTTVAELRSQQAKEREHRRMIGDVSP